MEPTALNASRGSLSNTVEFCLSIQDKIRLGPNMARGQDKVKTYFLVGDTYNIN